MFSMNLSLFIVGRRSVLYLVNISGCKMLTTIK